MQASYSHNGREALRAILKVVLQNEHTSIARRRGRANCRQESGVIEIYGIIPGYGRLLASIMHADRWLAQQHQGAYFYTQSAITALR